LTIFGVILGLVFLRYGLETVIISHFVINVLLVSLPLLKSESPYFLISGLIVLMFLFLPIIITTVIFKQGEKSYRKRTNKEFK